MTVTTIQVIADTIVKLSFYATVSYGVYCARDFLIHWTTPGGAGRFDQRTPEEKLQDEARKLGIDAK